MDEEIENLQNKLKSLEDEYKNLTMKYVKKRERLNKIAIQELTVTLGIYELENTALLKLKAEKEQELKELKKR